jgi:hypothetical protein
MKIAIWERGTLSVGQYVVAVQPTVILLWKIVSIFR